MKRVVILGGGVAGMSAAHELAERGFQVDVYEHKSEYCGGKARSVNVPDTAKDGRKPLPGEHGFRFFPGFYRHVTNTMKRIPTGDGHSVFENLVPTEFSTMGRYGKMPIKVLAHFPRNIAEVESMVSTMFHSDTGLTKEEEKFFGERVWQLMTSCKDRRLNEYEGLGWWEYLDADRFSDTYRTLLVEGLTRTLVAAKARTASTKTGGDIFLQLIYNTIDPFVNTDRVLNAPTNDAWLDPWFKHLTTTLGVRYHFGASVTDVVMKGGKVDHVIVQKGTEKIEVEGDHFIFAVPVERMAPLINDDMLAVDATLKYIVDLSPSVSWMNGLQVYLNTDVKIAKGHVICSDSQWAITLISQPQFWPGVNLSDYGDGKVKGLISIDISDWFNEGFNGKYASDCSKEEVFEEVWKQIKKSLNNDQETLLTDDMVMGWYLDSDIIAPMHHEASDEVRKEAAKNHNEEPLLVNRVNTWSLRPMAYTNIPNMYLASDYVKTNTDLATMEGANEAARRAVNTIIERSNTNAKPCEIWDLHEPWLLVPFRWRDQKRYNMGLPWQPTVGVVGTMVIHMLHYAVRALNMFKKKR